MYYTVKNLIGTLLAFAALAQPASADSEASLRRLLAEATNRAEVAGRALMSVIKSGDDCVDGAHDRQLWKKYYSEFSVRMALVDSEIKLAEMLPQFDVSRIDWIKVRFQVADIAMKKGCLLLADEQFRIVLKDNPEQKYAGYRDQAKIGIDDVRQKQSHSPNSAFNKRFGP